MIARTGVTAPIKIAISNNAPAATRRMVSPLSPPGIRILYRA
jgi:hypothetical protein